MRGNRIYDLAANFTVVADSRNPISTCANNEHPRPLVLIPALNWRPFGPQYREISINDRFETASPDPSNCVLYRDPLQHEP